LANYLLDHGHSVLTFDWYGHGYSESPDVPLSVDVLVKQLQQLLDVVIGTRAAVTLIGHSMGGFLSAAFAGTAPEWRVAKLVLVCPAGCIATTLSWRRTVGLRIVHNLTALLMVPVIGPRILAAAVAFGNITSAETLMRFMARRADKDKCREPEKASTRAAGGSLRIDSKDHLTGFVNNMQSIASEAEVAKSTGTRLMGMAALSTSIALHNAKYNPRFAASLSSILSELNLMGDRTEVFAAAEHPTRPTLIMWGTGDEYIPVECCDVLKDVMPSAQIFKFEEADHFVFLNKPTEFNAALNRFLAHTDVKHAFSALNLRGPGMFSPESGEWAGS